MTLVRAVYEAARFIVLLPVAVALVIAVAWSYPDDEEDAGWREEELIDSPEL